MLRFPKRVSQRLKLSLTTRGFSQVKLQAPTVTDATFVNKNLSKYNPSPYEYFGPSKTKYDAIIIGGGHNGLISAAYLAKAGLSVVVLERRHIIGGAAVTEELYKPGYKFSRASYLAGLLRPSIIKELELQSKYNLTFLNRDPSSFTPTKLNDPLYKGKSLMFFDDMNKTYDSIAQFSIKDADNYIEYEKFLSNIREILQPILDDKPPSLVHSFNDVYNNIKKSLYFPVASLKKLSKLSSLAYVNKNNLSWMMEFLTAPAQLILDKWFESDIVKTTLATDAVIGSIASPLDNGSAYVLLHHVMGQIEDRKGVWAYCKGGMGSISQKLGECCIDNGVTIIPNATVKSLLINNSNKLKINGVIMNDNSVIYSDLVLSNTTPYHTFIELLPNEYKKLIANNYINTINNADYSCGAFKINCVVDSLPNFSCLPNIPLCKKENCNHFAIGKQHFGTIHLESRMNELVIAANEAKLGMGATKPVIEMTIPSSLDNSIVPIDMLGKHHIIQLFVQYAPYSLNPDLCGVSCWDDNNGSYKELFGDRVFKIIDSFAPNFSKSVLFRDLLSPRDLEKVFGLHRGNIFHGALSLNQIGYCRPVPGYSNYRTPIDGLYLCGSGTHPGGGVMGAPGRNCSKQVLVDLKYFRQLKKTYTFR